MAATRPCSTISLLSALLVLLLLPGFAPAEDKPIPILKGVSPNRGIVTGGTRVTLSGPVFITTGTTQVKFGEAYANNVDVSYDEFSILCTTPAHDAGTVDVTVINPDGTSVTLKDGFTYWAPNQGEILRVNAASTTAEPDGKTWATAFPTLEAAIEAGNEGDELWVAAGTYTNPWTGENAAVATLKPAMLLYGGFAGTETTREQRDWVANKTIIDGQKERRCVSTIDETNEVDGCTLRNGNAGSNNGGGMEFGRATNCLFEKNRAICGGGMWEGIPTNCTFAGNVGDDAGGGMVGNTAINCFFTDNSSWRGGGMCGGTAVNCVFFRNIAGGGMEGGTAISCTFSGNIAGGFTRGKLINCICWGNVHFEAHRAEVTYSCLSIPTPGTGNIVANPRFVNPKTGNLRLRPDSPCINAGAAKDIPQNDCLGRPRPQGAGVDLGAYEYHFGDDTGEVDPIAVIYVNAASTAPVPDGLTWETAFPSLQAAATLGGYGAEIWVAAGVYTASKGDAVVKLNPVTSLFGGFSGKETAREQRDWTANKTIIDGQNARRGVYANEVDVVDGFIIQNCTCQDNAGMVGGTAVNCIFRENTATYDSVDTRGGGGMGYGTAINCVFIRNKAIQSGGGVYNCTTTNCTFFGNMAGIGGGICDSKATNCIFIDNTAGVGSEMADTSAIRCILWKTGLNKDSEEEKNLFARYRGWGAGDYIVADPLMVDAQAGDFRLQAGSPCIDAGTEKDAPAADILRTARPQGKGVDIGAHEYAAPAVEGGKEGEKEGENKP